jgi:hypothetical protein
MIVLALLFTTINIQRTNKKKECKSKKDIIIHITTENYFFIECEDILEKNKFTK